MPEGLTNYVLQERPIQPAVDLGVVTQSLATIHQGNKEALQTESALRSAIAEMDLNETEDNFRQVLFDDITKTIDENSIAGNAYYALDDIIKKQGDIASNPALLGRLKAQQAYKQYKETIDSRVAKGDISTDTGEWAKSLNPYHYEDKVDETGRIIGGSEWLPNMTPVSDIDINQVFDAVSKQLKPKSSTWSGGSVFMNADGTTSKNYVPGSTVSVWSESSGSYERITEDMISEAINNAFQNNPQLAAAARQQYDVLTWKADKGDLTPENDANFNGNGGYFDKSGVAKTYNQYIQDMINGYASTHAYNNTVSKISYNNSAINAAYKATQLSGARGYGNNNIFGDPLARTHQYNMMEVKKEMFGPATVAYNYTSSQVKSGLANLGINIDSLPQNPKSLYNLPEYKSLTDEQKLQFDNIVNYYIDQRDKWNSEYSQRESVLRGDGSKVEAKAALAEQILSDLRHGYDISDLLNSDNPYASEYKRLYSDVVNNSFGDNAALVFKTRNSNEFIQILNNNALSKTDLINLGFKVDDNSITIPKENSRLLLKFNDLIKSGKGDIYGIDNNGKQTRITNAQTQFGSFMKNIPVLMPATGISRSKQNFSRHIDKLSNKLNEAIEDDVNREFDAKNDIVYIGSSTAIGTDPIDLKNRAIYQATGEQDYKHMIDIAQETFNKYKTGAHIDEPIWLQSDTGVSTLITDTALKEKILNEIKYGGNDGKFIEQEPHVTNIKGIGVLPAFKYVIKDKDGNPITRDVIFSDYLGDPDYEAINNRPDIVTYNRLASYRVNGNLPVMIGKLHNNNVEARWINNSDNLADNQYYEILIAGSPTENFITEDQVNELSLSYNNLIDKRNKFALDIAQIQNDNISEEQKAEIINNYIMGYAQENPIFFEIFGNQAYDIISSTLTRQ